MFSQMQDAAEAESHRTLLAALLDRILPTHNRAADALVRSKIMNSAALFNNRAMAALCS